MSEGVSSPTVAIHDHRFEPVEIHVLQKVDGKAVDVTYKGGEKKITIPSNIPIVGLVPSEHSDIEPGAHVFVPTEKQPDGTLLAGAVLFGKGVVPPM